mgnify:CR=1 FL=1
MVGSDFVEDKEYKVKLNITIDKDIKELLQHSSVKTTQHYISLNREIVEKALRQHIRII